jgi:hypothetical protein
MGLGDLLAMDDIDLTGHPVKELRKKKYVLPKYGLGAAHRLRLRQREKIKRALRTQILYLQRRRDGSPSLRPRSRNFFASRRFIRSKCIRHMCRRRCMA